MVKPSAEQSADEVMIRTVSFLIRDFQDNLDDPSYCCTLLSALKDRDIARIRDCCPTPDENDTIARFKATYQIHSVLKRYRFREDIYSDDELIDKAISTFNETQTRIRGIDLDSLPIKEQRILNLARIYVTDVLGPYSDETHRSLCRFGRKASVGIPARLACEAARWELPISGSREQISWFDSEMSQVECVQDYWAAQKRRASENGISLATYHETDSLKLTLVPKTFKSLRSIMPNTTIGSYMSFGLGEMMRKRLKRVGYDIRSLQMTHRRLACQASVHGLCTTADLSSASDSISVALVRRLFPPDWFEILNRSRIGRVMLPDGSLVESETFCTMGVGYTFPLQTLVFLALLKAIEQVQTGRVNRRTISVYGDDMIYASSLHETVVATFERIGFVINLDKTFHEGHFRESCGGDYFRGVDVRPFQPRNGSACTRPKSREAMLYKYINGLLMRWSEYEIGRTLSFLCSQVESLTGKCKLVPHDFPDDSGIKVSLPLHYDFLRSVEVSKPKSLGHGLFRFSYLRLTPDEREEKRHEPYYWLSLRRTDHNLVIPDYGSYPKRPKSRLAILVDKMVGVTEAPNLLIDKLIRPIITVRSKLTGRRLRRTATFVTSSHTGRYTRQSGVSGFCTP